MSSLKEFINAEEPGCALDDAPKEPAWLRCKSSFWSQGFREPTFARCKSASRWRTAIPVAGSQSHRCSGGRSF